MKVYHIEYLYIGGQRNLQYEDIEEFSRALEGVIESEYTVAGTIKIWTEEKKK
jgi:hypothetical protein